jgi:hypothetical protein
VKSHLIIAAALWNLAATATAEVPVDFSVPAPRAFTSDSHIVSATVFHWYTSNGGQLDGPWPPPEGRAAWKGDVEFWQDQIKQMMSAGIDLINVIVIRSSEEQRVRLFEALAKLRAQGYDVPQVVPFLDPMITWHGKPRVNLATAAGQDEFVGQYIRFFNQYFSANTDKAADSYLATMNGRVILDTWHVKHNTSNLASLERSDIESRLAAALGDKHPMFKRGIHMITTAVNPPTLDFADEQVAQFEITKYLHVTTFNNYTAAQIKAGYWDQNVRNPGSILRRDGGVPYREAWAQVHQNPVIHHVNIESWNEYDEGSGIYRASTAPPYLKPGSGNTATDTWSATGDPLEYVKATAAGARAFNDTPDRDAKILWHSFPKRVRPGQEIDATVAVRNSGDLSWTAADQYKFGQQEFRTGEVLFGAGRFMLDDTRDEIPTYGGIFRGRPVMFTVHLVAPMRPGTYNTHWSMLQEHSAWFGEELDWTITVAP